MLSYRNKLYQNYNTNQVNQSGRHSFSQKFIEESEWFSKEILPLIQDKKELQILVGYYRGQTCRNYRIS